MKIELLSPVSMDVSHSESDIRFCTAEDEKILSQGLVGLLAVLVSDSDSVLVCIRRHRVLFLITPDIEA